MNSLHLSLSPFCFAPQQIYCKSVNGHPKLSALKISIPCQNRYFHFCFRRLRKILAYLRRADVFVCPTCYSILPGSPETQALLPYLLTIMMLLSLSSSVVSFWIYLLLHCVARLVDVCSNLFCNHRSSSCTWLGCSSRRRRLANFRS